jgi:hypothetical protein
MSDFSKRHYEAIATILREAKQTATTDANTQISVFEDNLISFFQDDNPKFDEDKFRAWINKE